MHLPTAPAMLIVLLFSSATNAGNEAESVIALGGPRNVSARIVEKGDDLEVTVEMLPVRFFDASMNLRLSRDKARIYVLHALKAHLAPDKKSVRITLRGAEVVKSQQEERVYVMTLRVRRSGVTFGAIAKRAVQREQITEQQPETDKRLDIGGSDLFTVKSDYLSTIESLGASYIADIPPIPAKAKLQQKFFEQIADLEDHVATGVQQLRTEFESDKRLLTIEVEELRKAAKTCESEVMSALVQQVEKCEAQYADK